MRDTNTATQGVGSASAAPGVPMAWVKTSKGRSHAGLSVTEGDAASTGGSTKATEARTPVSRRASFMASGVASLVQPVTQQ